LDNSVLSRPIFFQNDRVKQTMNAITLINPDYELVLNPDQGSWNLHSRHKNDLFLQGAQMGFSYTHGHNLQQNRFSFQHFSPAMTREINSFLGPAREITLTVDLSTTQIACQVTFLVPNTNPFVLWKIRVKNNSPAPILIHKLELLRLGYTTLTTGSPHQAASTAGKIKFHSKPGDLGFFANGWQSWNYTGAYRYYEHFRRTRLGPLTSPMRVNAGTPHPRKRGSFSSDFFGVLGDLTHRTGVLAGFISQNQHFGSLETYTDPLFPALRMWANGDHARLDPGVEMNTDWACLSFIHLDIPDPLDPYLTAVALGNNLNIQNSEAPTKQAIPSGWCSWYHYFQNISHEIITQNLQAAAEVKADLPLQLIQIDDGFQAQVGDWLAFNERFPQGVAPLAEAIRQHGFMPGIWLAPFIVHPQAKLAADHPDWLLKNQWGKPVNAGFIWNTFTHALDLTNPAALDYAAHVVDTAAHEWGFDYLKLDFLYAAALPGRYKDPTRTRAQVLRQGLQSLREAAGADKTLLGCGCPLGSALGLMDAMRIGADVAPNWHPRYFNTQIFFKPEPDFPSARNAVHNALTRAPLHQRWWINDPDCLLIRPDTLLSLAEVQTLATAIAITGGSLLLSDDLLQLPPDRLKLARALLPVIGKRPHILDWIDRATPARVQLDLEGAVGRWHLLALFNWADTPTDLVLNPGEFYLDVRQNYLARDFWLGTIQHVNSQGQTWRQVPAHGCVLLAVRPERPRPIYLGSDLHISQGDEVKHWQTTEFETRFTLCRPGQANGIVDLRLPTPIVNATLDGKQISWQQISPDIYRLPVNFDQETEVIIQTKEKP
jgi:alpha-galactosidase